MKKEELEKIPECKNCPHTVHQRRKFGITKHCTLDRTLMDVTHVKGKNTLCPLLRGKRDAE